MSDSEKMFVLTQNGEGKWEEYSDKYDITIHCKSEEEREKVMRIIQKAAKLLKDEKNNGQG